MSEHDTAPAPFAGPDPAALRVSWIWMLVLGIALVAIGGLGLGMAFQWTLVAMFWFGVLAVAAGVLQLLDVRHHQGWQPIVWHVLVALLYVVAGGFMIAMPVKAAFLLTLVIALALIAAGIMRLFIAFSVRRAGGPWVWVVVLALLSIALGVAVYTMVVPPSADALATAEGQRAWLARWGWVIGAFVSVEFVGQGLSMISIGLAARAAQRGTDRIPAT